MIDLFSEFNCIIESFQKEGLPYSVIGAFAVAIYGGARATLDMDFLVLSEEKDRIYKVLLDLGYHPNQPWKFKDTNITMIRFIRPLEDSEDVYMVDILLAANDRFRDIIKRSQEEEWRQGTIRVARQEDLIWMKSLRDSHADRADIEFLKQINETEDDESGTGDS